jgi:Protein of unknown function (DUF3592)
MPLSELVKDRPTMLALTMSLLALVAVLGWMTGRVWWERRLSREAATWPRTRGQVLETRFAWSSSPRSGTAYWPVIRYRYVAGDATFEADRVSFRTGYARSEVERAIRQYPVGAEVWVWYRPGEPRQAVLEPGTWNGGQRMRVLIPIEVAAIVATLISMSFLLFVSRPRR